MVKYNKLRKIDSTQSWPRTNKAARSIDDFTDGREGALSMTSPMDATEEGEQNNLKQNKMHESWNGIKTYTGNFKAGHFSTLSCQL
jgi:hypothetical protein